MALQDYFGPRGNKQRGAVFGSDRAKMIHQGCFSFTWAIFSLHFSAVLGIENPRGNLSPPGTMFTC